MSTIKNKLKKPTYLKLKKKLARNVILNTISVLLVLVGIVWGANFFMRYYRYEITNDATVEQYITPINSRITGYVKKVYFTEHQWVNINDTLLVIDDNELQGNPAYTVIKAPYSGYLGRRSLEIGQLIQAGQTITHLIKSGNKWIVANYREKQITNIYIGQKVNIKIDALKGKTFQGIVTAISEATGSKFSMLPTDNSAGNFVKIQQRIPVRIDFENIDEESMKQLRIGMMAVTEAIKK